MIFFKALKVLKALNDLVGRHKKGSQPRKLRAFFVCVNCIPYETIFAAAG